VLLEVSVVDVKMRNVMTENSNFVEILHVCWKILVLSRICDETINLLTRLNFEITVTFCNKY